MLFVKRNSISVHREVLCVERFAEGKWLNPAPHYNNGGTLKRFTQFYHKFPLKNFLLPERVRDFERIKAGLKISLE